MRELLRWLLDLAQRLGRGLDWPLLLALGVVSPMPARAQTMAATLFVEVRDQGGASLPDVTITLTDQQTQLMREGIISGGMIPKVDCCIEAIRRGVGRVFIIDGRIPHAILIETLTDEGIGTMFT